MTGLRKGENTLYAFLSYAREDLKAHKEVIELLDSKLGERLWRDTDTDLGVSWESHLIDKLVAASCVLAVVSRQSLESPWVKHEVGYALSSGKLLMLSVDSTFKDLPEHHKLKTLQAVEVESGNVETSVNRIVDSVVSQIDGRARGRRNRRFGLAALAVATIIFCILARSQLVSTSSADWAIITDLNKATDRLSKLDKSVKESKSDEGRCWVYEWDSDTELHIVLEKPDLIDAKNDAENIQTGEFRISKGDIVSWKDRK